MLSVVHIQTCVYSALYIYKHLCLVYVVCVCLYVCVYVCVCVCVCVCVSMRRVPSVVRCGCTTEARCGGGKERESRSGTERGPAGERARESHSELITRERPPRLRAVTGSRRGW